MSLVGLSKRCLIGAFTIATTACSSLSVQDSLYVDDRTCDMFIQTIKKKKEKVVDEYLTPLYDVSQRCLDRQDVQREMEILTITAASGDRVAAMTFMNLLAEKNSDINNALQASLLKLGKETKDIQGIALAETESCKPYIDKADGALVFRCTLK